MSEDLISRQAAIDAMEQAKERYFDRKVIIGKMQDIVNNLPTAQVERKSGKWARKEIHSNWSDWTEDTCSLCGTTFKGLYKANFCPNCGAQMEG